MRRAILVSVYHGYSTDDFPQHQFCPPGPNSWCFYTRNISEHTYPCGHKQRVHTPLAYDLLHKHLQPIYDRLASVELLRRCELKTTQNPNESFHHSVWSRCTKKNFHSLKRVEFALISAAAEQNRGPTAVSTIKDILGITTSTLSRWIREVMSQFGIDTKRFRPHSTRSAAAKPRCSWKRLI
ncbi:hypothetical protein ElyMa_001167000 [Elysia marginata]|uniref:Transposase Tc1-like domain-containing protein n=1 Tax=Elysia marginata TaxID=1093978 RepID=A0AAV4I535_9GAST|nr:hypothetical protein ElyMa_001167000 [Elysia marginata]